MTGVAIGWRSSAVESSVVRLMVRLLDDAARLGDPHQISGTLAWNDSPPWRPEAKVPPAGGRGRPSVPRRRPRWEGGARGRWHRRTKLA